MDELRLPPQAIEAEQSVLGALMIEPSALAKIADWLPEDAFFRRTHQLIYRAVAHLAGAGQPCDAVTMGEWFADNGLAEESGGMSYVIDLANNTPGAANIVAYAEIVAEKAKLRSLIDVGMTVAGAAYGPGKSSTDIAASALHELSVLTASTARGGLAPVKPAMKILFDEMMLRYQRGPALLGLPTPWSELNEVTKGLRDGTLYIVGARPSMGKSAMLGMLAAFTALRGDRTAFFAVEGSAQELLSRSIAAIGDIPYDWVEQPNDSTPDAELYWQRQTSTAAKLIEAPLLIDDTAPIGIAQIKARCRREHMRAPLRLIVIDHMHDMEIDGRREARHEYGRIAQGGKEMAKEFGCPVVIAAQLNRNNAGKRPTLVDLRESGEIEQKGDVILFLHREDYYDSPERQTHLQGVVEVIPAKGRNIRIGTTVHLKNRFDRMRLEDWEGPLPHAPAQEQRSRGAGIKAKKDSWGD